MSIFLTQIFHYRIAEAVPPLIYPYCTEHQAYCSRISTAHQSIANCPDWLTLRGSQAAWVPA